MDFIDQYMIETLAVLGIVLLAVEMLVLGFSTFVLTYLGLALVITSGAMFFGLIPVTIESAVLSSAILSALAWAVLWKPLKKLQSDVDDTPVTSDMIGHSFVLESDIGPSVYGKHHYSGIDWKVTSDQDIAAGSRVNVVELTVGEMRVEAADKA